MSTGAAGALGDPLGGVGRGDVDAPPSAATRDAPARPPPRAASADRRADAARRAGHHRRASRRCPAPCRASCAQRGARRAPAERAVAAAEEHGVDEQREQLPQQQRALMWPGARVARPPRRPRRRAPPARRTGAASPGRPRGGRRRRPGPRGATGGPRVSACTLPLQRSPWRRAGGSGGTGQLRQALDHRARSRRAPPAGQRAAVAPPARSSGAQPVLGVERAASRRAVAVGQRDRAEPQPAVRRARRRRAERRRARPRARARARGRAPPRPPRRAARASTHSSARNAVVGARAPPGTRERAVGSPSQLSPAALGRRTRRCRAHRLATSGRRPRHPRDPASKPG